MGIAVFSGMLGVTFFGLMLTPLFYVLVRRITQRASAAKAAAATPVILDHPPFGDETG
jgi:multidrug efflux pump